MSDLKSDNAAEIEALKTSNLKQIKELQAAHKAEVEAAKTAHLKQVNGFRAINAANYKDAQEHQTARKAKIRELHSTIGTLTASNANLQDAHDENAKNIKLYEL
jgi:hypothetical protein